MIRTIALAINGIKLNEILTVIIIRVLNNDAWSKVCTIGKEE